MKIKRLLLSSSVLLMTTLGLAGCASSINKSASSDSSSKVKTSKVTESHKNSTKENNSANSSSKKNSSSSKVSDNDVAKIDSNSNSSASSQGSSVKSNASSQTSIKAANGTATSASQQSTSGTKANQSSNIQLGLSDVAVWTDENGVTHHVDSDGMDRQTTNGSNQITYNDWSGDLPSNAKVVQAH
ncbi:CDP-diacylglycerol diphosphatase [Limosilactobacillus sp. RRLNB_1_1]|uniref:CDP-diacylglycerol diphosphatase n=1 Tax=Limosilactobacillus albertensis TaxID=2759752 RepID=A0A7W3TSM8_9LACO|nr:CDP-diacylglycerol diphosphatase [Limosilactobacillus albertensis]MBB1070175.1 CDP-diacylglycerol diphosphatase [Limosilactobacillus albertensis]MCD7118840.1 CDP-diacylglycerol diphosphatase [Limosilactobacillus albertensis]MCD7128950.1 CDP-diacylglycerol diphosphatase [Limosilactobacillus albertensis]